MDKRATAWLLCVSSVSCTTLLGIDDDYHARSIEPGGGRGGDSGRGGGGGGAAGGSSGRDASSSDGSGGACAAGEKFCPDGGCFRPDPIIGCLQNGCEACPAPPEHAVPACNGELCDFACVPDYERQGDACMPSGAGGAAGQDASGGSGGSPPRDAGTCNPLVCPADGACSSDCPPCVAPLPAPGCCLADGTCGGLVLGVCYRCFL